MKQYIELTDEQVEKYKSMLKLPNIEFPHYEHLMIDNEVVYKYQDNKLLTGEEFKATNYFNKYNIDIIEVPAFNPEVQHLAL
jgi:hypothetical protein